MRKLTLNSTVYALLTIGGTEEPLDGVRSLANHAEGDYGVEAAKAFLECGIRVIIVAGRKAQLKHAFWLATTRNVSTVPFSSIASYDAAIEGIVRDNGQPAYAFATAAISDFIGTGSTGKVASDQPYCPTLMPAAKSIDGWRALFGRRCFIVGFKYLAEGASVAEVLRKAREQNHRAHLNATFANLKGEIGEGLHPGWIVKPDGGAIRLEGKRSRVAEQLVAFAVRMTRTTWSHSEYDGPRTGLVPSDTLVGLLAFAQETHLLTDRSGNVAEYDVNDGRVWVTPRGVDKSVVTADACVPTEFDPETRTVSYRGDLDRKPSIDTSVYHRLAEHIPDFGAALHFHDALVVGGAKTREGYPCGTEEESWMIIEALAASRPKGDSVLGMNGRMVELAEHGYMLVLPDDGGESFRVLEADWEAVRVAYVRHLEDVAQLHRLPEVRLSPIFHGNAIIGVAARHATEEWTSIYLVEAVRGSGVGYDIVQLVNERGMTVGVHANCRVRDYYVSHGFQVVSETDGVSVLIPPSLRTDLVDAATIRVTCKAERMVLLGQRAMTKPDGSPMTFGGLWANLGGQIDDDDRGKDLLSPPGAVRGSWAAAVREVGEEQTGIDLSAYPAPDPSGVYYTGTAMRGYRVVVYDIDLPSTPHVRTRNPGELARVDWNAFGSIPSLPMAQATKATMRPLLALV